MPAFIFPASPASPAQLDQWTYGNWYVVYLQCCAIVLCTLILSNRRQWALESHANLAGIAFLVVSLIHWQFWSSIAENDP